MSRVSSGVLSGLAVAALAVGISGGCKVVTVHPVGQAPSAPVAEAVQPRVRHRALAEGVELYATLWDPTLVAADDPASVSHPATRARRVKRWNERYVAGTSVTVVLELANRSEPAGDEPDAMLSPKGWSFELEAAKERFAAKNVWVQGIDRFPTQAGTHHYRVTFVVDFERPLRELGSPGTPLDVQLRVKCLARYGKRRRELGAWLARRGAVMHWTVLIV